MEEDTKKLEEEVVVGYSAAQLVYNASLTAASKVIQQTLLDFL